MVKPQLGGLRPAAIRPATITDDAPPARPATKVTAPPAADQPPQSSLEHLAEPLDPGEPSADPVDQSEAELPPIVSPAAASLPKAADRAPRPLMILNENRQPGESAPLLIVNETRGKKSTVTNPAAADKPVGSKPPAERRAAEPQLLAPPLEEENLAPIISAAEMRRRQQPAAPPVKVRPILPVAPISPHVDEDRPARQTSAAEELPVDPPASDAPAEDALEVEPDASADVEVEDSEPHDAQPPSDVEPLQPAAAEPLPVETVELQPLAAEPLLPIAASGSDQPVASEPQSETDQQESIPPPRAQVMEFDSPRSARLALRQSDTQPDQPPPPAAEPLPAGRALPEGSPFEAIGESGTLQVQVRRSLLLRTQTDVYRTAVVDDAVCEIVQFTPRELSIIGRSTGSTHVTFWFDDPNMQPVTYVVQVEPDAAKVKEEEEKYEMLEDVLNEMFPDSKIKLTLVADKLIVRGQAKDSEEAFQIMTIVRGQAGFRGGLGTNYNAGINEGQAAQVLADTVTGAARRNNYQIVNMLRVPGVQQVALRVKIAELNRSAARNFGLDVSGTINLDDTSNIILNSLSSVTSGENPPILFNVDGDDITIGLNALQQHGVVKLLSEPTLVTMSGRPATFLAGGEFAVPTVVGSAGLNAVTTDFRAFGAIISFLPTVVDKDRIRLEVAPEFSEINSDLSTGGTSTGSIPGLNVRAATTTVEMREGQTLAIAGLLQDSMTANNAGDLPFLQRIIGRRSVTRNENELIILVTPELVHPMEPEEVPPLPGFDVTEPTNAQFYLHGDLEGNPTMDYRSTVWPRLKKRYKAGGPAMTSGPFGHGQ